jgi:hypothetical protein
MEDQFSSTGCRVYVFVMLMNPIFRLFRAVIISMRCLSDLPNLSSRQTTSVSPSLTYSNASSIPFLQTFPFYCCAAYSVSKYFEASDFIQYIPLEVEGLVLCGNSRIADKHRCIVEYLEDCELSIPLLFLASEMESQDSLIHYPGQ